MKGKDEFFDTKMAFLVTIYKVREERGKREYYGPFKKRVVAYRADDGFEIMRKFIGKHNKKRKGDEPEWMVTAIERAPEDS